MKSKEFAIRLERKIKALEEDNKPFEIGVTTIISDLIPRVFEEGVSSDGGRIGQYDSSTPLYVNTSKNARIKNNPKGKNGESKFKNGKPKVTTYYENYKDFRQKQGCESSFVNLDLTGELQRDLANGLYKIDSNNFSLTVKQDINSKKIEGNEKRFGKEIFDLTKEEEEKLIDIIDKELQRWLEI